jgi:hypothetical protein
VITSREQLKELMGVSGERQSVSELERKAEQDRGRHRIAGVERRAGDGIGG